MKTFIKLYSDKKGEISSFLEKFYSIKGSSDSSTSSFFSSSLDSSLLEWEEYFDNPVEMANIIGVFIDNSDNFKINMWACLDEDILINVTQNNANDIIKYLYERFPY